MSTEPRTPAKNHLKVPLVASLIANGILVVVVILLSVFYVLSSRDLDISRFTTTGLQVELSGVKAELSKESARAAELKTDLNSTRADVQSLSKQSTDLRSAVSTKEQALAEEKARTEAAQVALEKEKSRLPEVPVRVQFRRSQMGRGLVGMFSNYSAKQLTVVMAFRNPTTGQTKQLQQQIAPGAVLEIGYQEGWQFASGDQIAIRSAGFEIIRSVVP